MFYPKQVDLHTLKAGDTVELASGATKEIRSVAYDSILRSVQVVFTTCKSILPWYYNRNGTLPGFPMDSIVKIIPKPKLDFSMNTVGLTTLKEGDTVHLSNRSTAEVVSIASNMLGTVYLIRLRRFGFNHYCVDGCSLDKDKPSIVRIVPKPSVTDKPTGRELGAVITFARPKFSFGIDPTVTRENLYDALRESTLFAGSTPLGISQFVDSLFSVDLTTLQPGDTVELANGKTEKVERIAYGSLENPFRVYFAGSLDLRGWFYSASGNCAGVEGRRITRIIPQPKPSPTLALEMSPDSRFITPRITVRGTGATAATVRSKPKLNLYTLQPGAVVTLANGNTKAVLKVDLQSRAHTNHICITFADGVWIYNPDGTRPPGRDSAYNIVGVSQSNPQTEPASLIVNGHTIKPGDCLRLRNGTVNTVKDVTWNEHDDNWTVAYGGEFAGSLRNFSYYSSGKNPFNSEFDIAAVVNRPTPLTIGGHIVKPGDVLTRANGDRIVVDKITPEPCGNWKVWHSAHGGCFFEVDSSGRCSELPSLTITAVVSNLTTPPCRWPANPFWYLSSSQSPRQVPWPKPITTPPTKKDADPISQVAVLDKEGDWMQEEWWAACDMLAAGEITGWAHTQAWYDASDPWN